VKDKETNERRKNEKKIGVKTKENKENIFLLFPLYSLVIWRESTLESK
jgi:hypothetical protein